MRTTHRDTPPSTRRPLASREAAWAQAAARWLTRAGVRPNHVSVASVAFAGLAGACLTLSRTAPIEARVGLFVGAAFCIQLRLLCNLLDGMVAIEGGRRTPTGELFNEFPDRLSDVIVLVAAAHAVPGAGWVHELGWAAAVLAVMTAYVRALGGAQGVPQPFCGPMAKPHRMAVLTLACLLAAVEAALGARPLAIMLALAVIAVGSAITIARRLSLIAGDLACAPRDDREGEPPCPRS